MLLRLSEMLTLPFISKFKKSAQIGNVIIKCVRSQSTSSSSLSYCVQLVKRLDYENYLCTVLLPPNLKATAFAIRAFNIELSRIQDQVTEPHIMPLRFKFWDDCVNDIFSDKVVNHPVVIELKNAVRRHKLSKMFLKRLVSSRSSLINRSTFKNMKEMELYADQTNSPVYMLLLEAHGVRNINCDHVASHLGMAQGISNLVRGLPFNLKERLILMPMSILSKHDVSEESLFRYSAGEKLNQIVFDVAKIAVEHLETAQSLKDKIPEELRSIFLPAVTVDAYLSRLEHSGFDVFADSKYVTKGFLPLKLMWNNFRKSF